ncbi:hypothetical protein GH714_020904 [Hevea brasiliensis]|uniref:Clp ATPase C-terminal domain-containing protein n=1 Tax=Hevea brasiliensis TaxID=3981 RepID=A0A6A6MFJ0_HEVBR|nr:hypothetical protein GH714_020904 [Hevea brasiliensis]
MTSNLGAEHLLSGLMDKCSMQVARDRVMQEVRKHFRPELLNRLDEIVVYGARPIRRWLEKKVVTELSRMLIREEIDENSTVYIDAGRREVTWHIEWRRMVDLLMQPQDRRLKY